MMNNNDYCTLYNSILRLDALTVNRAARTCTGIHLGVVLRRGNAHCHIEQSAAALVQRSQYYSRLLQRSVYDYYVYVLYITFAVAREIRVCPRFKPAAAQCCTGTAAN